eukprot:3484955-Rhodomonas_salina.1
MNRAAARPSTARFCILSVRERVVQSRGCLSIRQTDAWLQPELKGFEAESARKGSEGAGRQTAERTSGAEGQSVEGWGVACSNSDGERGSGRVLREDTTH